ncbi:MAG TPA: hypothetical protein VGM69_01885 [Chloroflexota bacterium]|jgi:hypothetical protein
MGHNRSARQPGRGQPARKASEAQRAPIQAGLGPVPLGVVGARAFSPAWVLALQRRLGNQAVLRAVATVPRRGAQLGRGPVRADLEGPTSGASPRRPPERARAIQRHSSWEHKLLGDAKPEVLASFGTWQDLLNQTERVGPFGGVSKSRTLFGTPRQQEAEVDVPGVGKISKGQVMHNLAQEMTRLKAWQDSPPKAASTADALTPAGQDPQFEVVTVMLPSKGSEPSLLITYGEMNTLADFYGDLETMKSANPKHRRQIVQSVRKETFLRLKEIYDKVTGSLTDTEKADKDVRGAQALFKANKLGKATFKGAAAPDFISGKAGQADLLAGDKPLIGQGTGAKGETNKYGATLARNACHFVPESWHSWAAYHDSARAAAKRAYALRDEVRTLRGAFDRENFDRRPLDQAEADANIRIKQHGAAEAANEALLLNGFGDHYLQDSYAAGHMLNKTQIMQWYVEFIDKNDEWDYFRDKNWRKVQQMAYRQPGLAAAVQYDKSRVKGATAEGETPRAPRNPQMVENIAGDDWKVRFDALGLQVPASLRTPGSPERQLVEWWQRLAAQSSGKRTQTGARLLANGPIDSRTGLQKALKNLILDGVVRSDEENTTRGDYMSWGEEGMKKAKFIDFGAAVLVLREDYVPKDKKRFKAALARSQGTAEKAGDDSDYQRMAAAVTYGDYFEFMQSGFIQKATNALHDTFCQEGLSVVAGDGPEVFKVYGDDAMFNQDSARGVKHSGETANMSRDAILSLINTDDDGGRTAASILARLPQRVKGNVKAGGETVYAVDDDLEVWHNSNKAGSLKNLCFANVFPAMSWSLMQKMVPGVAGSELGTISQDTKVHGAEAF